MVSVGIDIGAFSVKLAEIHATSKSYILTRFQEFPLPTDPNKDQKIEILSILKQIAGQYDPDQTKFVFAIHQDHVSLRYRNFPFRERHKILRSIAFELEDDIPFSQDDAIFDAKITRFVDNSADVLACAVPKHHIKDLIQIVMESGLDPDIVTIEGLALGNLIEKWSEPPPTLLGLAPTPEARSAELLLDIGHERSVLTILSEGSILTSRNIDFGGRTIAEALANKYNLHYLEALKELQKKAFVLLSAEGATRDQVVFSDVIKAAFNPLIQEVKFSILEITATRNLRMTQAHICGGPSQIKNLGAFLTQAWEIPVNRLQQLGLHPQVQFEIHPSTDAISAMAVALALEGLRRPRNPAINLRKDDFAPRSETFKLLWQKWSYTARLLGAAFVILIIYGVAREQLAASMNERGLEVLKEQAKAIAGLDGRQASNRNIRNFVKQKKAELASRKLAERVNEINSAMDFLTLISSQSPSAKQMVVEIRRFKLDNESLEIHGETPSPEMKNKFAQVLENIASNGKITPIAPLIAVSPGKVPFAYQFKVDRRQGG